MTRRIPRRALAVAVLALAACSGGCERPATPASSAALIGQWRSRVQFSGGALASVRDLEFMYVFNQGGTMTESSNYDGMPPVPPAYGIWRAVNAKTFEARYEFYSTKPPARLEDLTGGGGWTPSGRGVLTERLTLSGNGNAFTSTIRYEAFDAEGKPVAGGGEARGRGTRLGF